ncbi:MAG: hypothetical protein K9J06_11775, partial [Flavobacteriales bacterium]|nr:hypothetical protein [Flavobacteriales bacterium]
EEHVVPDNEQEDVLHAVETGAVVLKRVAKLSFERGIADGFQWFFQHSPVSSCHWGLSTAPCGHIIVFPAA